MARDYFVNAETMVSVKGNVNSSIAAVQQLGLSDTQVRITLNLHHLPIHVNAFLDVPPEYQFSLGEAMITTSLVNFDRAYLDECWRLSMGAPTTVGTMPRAGTRMGGGVARFAAGWNFISLNFSSPVGGKPINFLNTFMTGPASEFPLGNERSVVVCQWKATLYQADPWGGGTGAKDAILWQYSND